MWRSGCRLNISVAAPFVGRNPSWVFDAKRFSEFSWLVVEEMYLLDREPGVRAIPWFFETLSGDWGRIRHACLQAASSTDNLEPPTFGFRFLLSGATL